MIHASVGSDSDVLVRLTFSSSSPITIHDVIHDYAMHAVLLGSHADNMATITSVSVDIFVKSCVNDIIRILFYLETSLFTLRCICLTVYDLCIWWW